MVLRDVAVKLNTHAEVALYKLALAVLFLYATIAFFIASTYTEDGAKTATQVLGYVCLVVATGYGLVSFLRYQRPILNFST